MELWETSPALSPVTESWEIDGSPSGPSVLCHLLGRVDVLCGSVATVVSQDLSQEVSYRAELRLLAEVNGSGCNVTLHLQITDRRSGINLQN